LGACSQHVGVESVLLLGRLAQRLVAVALVRSASGSRLLRGTDLRRPVHFLVASQFGRTFVSCLLQDLRVLLQVLDHELALVQWEHLFIHCCFLLDQVGLKGILLHLPRMFLFACLFGEMSPARDLSQCFHLVHLRQRLRRLGGGALLLGLLGQVVDALLSSDVLTSWLMMLFVFLILVLAAAFRFGRSNIAEQRGADRLDQSCIRRLEVAS